MKRIMITMLVVLLSSAFLSLANGAAVEKVEDTAEQDLLIKCEIETALSMLQAIYAKHQQGEMTLEQAKKSHSQLEMMTILLHYLSGLISLFMKTNTQSFTSVQTG